MRLLDLDSKSLQTPQPWLLCLRDSPPLPFPSCTLHIHHQQQNIFKVSRPDARRMSTKQASENLRRSRASCKSSQTSALLLELLECPEGTENFSISEVQSSRLVCVISCHGGTNCMCVRTTWNHEHLYTSSCMQAEELLSLLQSCSASSTMFWVGDAVGRAVLLRAVPFHTYPVMKELLAAANNRGATTICNRCEPASTRAHTLVHMHANIVLRAVQNE